MKLNFTQDKFESASVLLVILDNKIHTCDQLNDDLKSYINTNESRLTEKLNSGEFESFKLSSTNQHVMFYNLGNQDQVTAENFRVMAGHYAQELKLSKSTTCSIVTESFDNENQAVAFMEAFGMALHKYDEFISDTSGRFEVESLTTNSEKYSAQLNEGMTISDAVNTARNLCLKPGNALTPNIFANLAEEMSKQNGLKYTVLDEAEMEKLEMGALLAVSRGSTEEAKMMIMEYEPESKETDDVIIFVGKGLTFDAGGISIKPAANMHLMKKDMSGGAAVFGIMNLVSEMKLPIKVIGIIPSSENLINGEAVKPGDIVKASDGSTIEVLNTDAEGRLILCDALTYARRFNPTQIINIATLTGAISIALGDQASGLMGNDSELVNELIEAGKDSHERVWELPLFEEYYKQLKSPVADIANIGGRKAGSITAGAFLGHFTKGMKWAHLDIAGTSWGDKKTSYLLEGSTGVGVRLFYYFLKNKLKK